MESYRRSLDGLGTSSRIFPPAECQAEAAAPSRRPVVALRPANLPYTILQSGRRANYKVNTRNRWHRIEQIAKTEARVEVIICAASVGCRTRATRSMRHATSTALGDDNCTEQSDNYGGGIFALPYCVIDSWIFKDC
ncbi:hypothetical protein ACJJTC_006138 [Scirpophaga incertulas]